MSYQSAVLALSPLGAWTQDHDPGYTDYSGNARNLGLTSGVTYGGADPGRLPNTSTAFSGNAGAGTSSAGSWAAGLSAFTVATWFKMSSIASSGTVLAAVDNAGLDPADSRRVWNLTIQSGGNARFECYNTSGGGIAHALSAGTNYADGNWHRLAAVYNAGAITLRIDKTQIATGTQTGTLNNGGTSPFTLASCINGSTALGGASVSLTGSQCMSEFYGSALSTAQLDALYDAAFAGPSPLITTRAAIARAATR